MALQKFITGAFLLAMVSSASAATPTPTTTGPTTTGITTGGGTVTTSTSTGTCPSPYTVTAGDNCWKVAVDHQVSPWWEIYWFNTALCAPSNAMNLQPSDVLCLTGTPQNAPPTASVPGCPTNWYQLGQTPCTPTFTTTTSGTATTTTGTGTITSVATTTTNTATTTATTTTTSSAFPRPIVQMLTILAAVTVSLFFSSALAC